MNNVDTIASYYELKMITSNRDYRNRLDPNYAYSLLDVYLQIQPGAGATNNFGNQANGQWADAVVGADRKLVTNFELHNEGVALSSAVELRQYTAVRTPQIVLLPALAAEQCQLNVAIYNATANDGAYSVDFIARFLQFGVEQAHHYRVNTPQLVRP